MTTTLSKSLSSARVEAGVAEIVLAVAEACTRISAKVRTGGLGGVLGAHGATNSQGEQQKKLDVISNEIMLQVCSGASRLVAMASEEMADIHPVRRVGPDGGYLLVFDPLDGSSNIDVNVSIGSIFSVLPAPAGPEREPAAEDFFQPGRRQIAAGYAVYGPQTSLVLTTGQGVDVFTLDPDGGEWILTQAGVSIPPDTKEFAVNASNMRHWASPVRRYIEECLAGEAGPRCKNFNMRWVGSMVADVHRILMRGGVFLYPWDAREPDKPGKLRLLYEGNPMALVVEQAGGASYAGACATLDVAPTSLHQKVPVMLGSRNEVERLEAYHTGALEPA